MYRAAQGLGYSAGSEDVLMLAPSLANRGHSAHRFAAAHSVDFDNKPVPRRYATAPQVATVSRAPHRTTADSATSGPPADSLTSVEPGGTLISRRRLAARAAGATVVAAIAGSGYGKSVVLREMLSGAPGAGVLVELAQRTTPAALLDAALQACRAQGLSDLARALTAAQSRRDPDAAVAALLAELLRAEGLWLGIDEAHRLDDQASMLLADTYQRLHPPGMILLAGKSLPGPLIRTAGASGGVLLTSVDLAFTENEIAELLEHLGHVDVDRRAASIVVATHGWPTAVSLAAIQPGSDAGSAKPPTDVPGTDALHDILSAASPLDIQAVASPVRALASLPVFSVEICEIVTGAADLTLLRAAGIPAVCRQDGWWEIAEPIRRHIADPDALTPAQRAAVATVYTRLGRLRLAFDILSEEPAIAAELLADQPVEALTSLGTSGIDAVLGRVGDALLTQRPEGLVNALRFAATLPMVGEHQSWLARAERVVGDDHPLRPFVLAESARVAVRNSDLELAESLARRAIAHPAATGADRGRAELALGLLSAYRSGSEALRSGAEHLEAAVELLRASGDRRGEAEALTILAYGIDFNLGVIPVAVRGLRHVVEMLPFGDMRSVEALTCLAEVLCWLPDLPAAEVALRQAEIGAARLRDERLTAYVQWTWAWVDAFRRDIPALRARVQTLLTMTTGLWYSSINGAALHSDLAEIFASVGEIDDAVAHLDIAQQRIEAESLTGVPIDAAWVAVHARHGDPAAARARIAELVDAPDTAPVHRWRYHLLAAWSAHRLGDDPAASDHAVAAFASATDSGYAAMVDAVEPELAAWARRLIGRADADIVYEITVIGDFVVRRGDALVTPPSGAARQMIGALVVGGPQTVEQLADVLWPNVGTAVGRARMRNLLNRIRSAAGDLVGRTHGRIAVVDTAVVDWHRFQQAVSELDSRASGNDSTDDLTSSIAALQIGDGELLPSMGGDWLDVARAKHARLRLELHDRVSWSAERAGNLDLAIRSLGEAIAADPLDTRWSIRQAELLSRQGRRVAARNAIARAFEALAEFETEPEQRLLAAARKFGGAPAAAGMRRSGASGAVPSHTQGEP